MRKRQPNVVILVCFNEMPIVRWICEQHRPGVLESFFFMKSCIMWVRIIIIQNRNVPKSYQVFFFPQKELYSGHCYALVQYIAFLIGFITDDGVCYRHIQGIEILLIIFFCNIFSPTNCLTSSLLLLVPRLLNWFCAPPPPPWVISSPKWIECLLPLGDCGRFVLSSTSVDSKGLSLY